MSASLVGARKTAQEEKLRNICALCPEQSTVCADPCFRLWCQQQQKQRSSSLSESGSNQSSSETKSTSDFKSHLIPSKVLTTPQNSLLAKDPSFIPTPNDVNWLSVRRELDGFINQVRYFANNTF